MRDRRSRPAGAAATSAAVSFEISYVAEDGAEHRVPLDEVWQVPVEARLTEQPHHDLRPGLPGCGPVGSRLAGRRS